MKQPQILESQSGRRSRWVRRHFQPTVKCGGRTIFCLPLLFRKTFRSRRIFSMDTINVLSRKRIFFVVLKPDDTFCQFEKACPTYESCIKPSPLSGQLQHLCNGPVLSKFCHSYFATYFKP